MSSDAATITKAVFDGLGGITQAVAGAVDLSALVDEAKASLRQIVAAVIAVGIILTLLFAGILIATSMTAAAVWPQRIDSPHPLVKIPKQIA